MSEKEIFHNILQRAALWAIITVLKLIENFHFKISNAFFHHLSKQESFKCSFKLYICIRINKRHKWVTNINSMSKIEHDNRLLKAYVHYHWGKIQVLYPSPALNLIFLIKSTATYAWTNLLKYPRKYTINLHR